MILASLWNDGDAPLLAATLSRMHSSGALVYILGPLPYYDQPLPALLFSSLRSGDKTLAARHMRPILKEYKELDRSLEAAVEQSGFDKFVSLRRQICPEDTCLLYAAPGIPLQSDMNHLTDQGSVLVIGRLRARGLLW